MIDFEVHDWTDNALQVFTRRFCRKGENEVPIEDPEDAIFRVADNVSVVNALYDEGAWAPWSEADVNEALDAGFDPDRFPYRTANRKYEWLCAHSERLPKVCGWSGAQNPPPLEVVLYRGREKWYAQREKYLKLLRPLVLLPNSPTWTGAGTELGQLSACFVLPIDDDLVTGRASIFETLKVAAAIQQTGGGNGFDFSSLRPMKTSVHRSMGFASGPVGFLHAYDQAFGVIGQGGSRSGANMAIMRIDHPDVEAFIRAKVDEGVIENFNISCAITDEFMRSVEGDDEFLLRWYGTHKTSGEAIKVEVPVQARDLFDLLARSAWEKGDPGCFFIDRANADNPCPTRYAYRATNPCGEEPLPDYGNCTLATIALQPFVSRSGRFDWDAFGEAVEVGADFLDDVVDANQYVATVPEIAEAAENERRIGLDFLGLWDALVVMGIRYGSSEAQEWAGHLAEALRFHTMRASIRRAAERGPFPWIEDSIYDPAPLKEFGSWGRVSSTGPDGSPVEFRLWSPPPVHEEERFPWTGLIKDLTRHGIRNATQITFAPTGTRGTVALRRSTEGWGIEPNFSLSYTRTVSHRDGTTSELVYGSPLFEEALELEGISEAAREEIYRAVKQNGGSCQGIVAVPGYLRHAFVVAADVTPEEHVRMQAALQTWNDEATSKTINMPFGATVEDVADTYLLAWKLGCKGITIYRQGSREREVLTTAPKTTDGSSGYSMEIAFDELGTHWPLLDPVPMPDYVGDRGLAARVIPIPTPFGTLHVTLTELDGEEGRPFDVRLGVGKAGNDTHANAEAIGRAVSLALRTGTRVDHVVEQLRGIGGRSVVGFGDQRVSSIGDALARLLAREYLGEADEQLTARSAPQAKVPSPHRVCPECGNHTLVEMSGCFACSVELGGCGLYNGCD